MPGFTKVDNPVLEKLLTSGLTKRQLKILLLVIRFSAGYQKGYAVLRKGDFAYAGVSPYHIAEELRKLARMRVLQLDESRDTVWLNPNLDDWRLESVEDHRRRFFKIAAKNSPKWQLAVCRNGKRRVPKAVRGEKESEAKRERREDSIFLDLLQEYFLRVAPLNVEETLMLRQSLESYGLRAMREAIRTVAAGHDRRFRHFLKTLDGIASTTRAGGLSSLRSGLERYVRLLRRS